MEVEVHNCDNSKTSSFASKQKKPKAELQSDAFLHCNLNQCRRHTADCTAKNVHLQLFLMKTLLFRLVLLYKNQK